VVAPVPDQPPEQPVADHDPLPLLDQLHNRYGEGVEITYRAREPGQIVIDFAKRG